MFANRRRNQSLERLQRKCLLIVALIVLTESIAITNAVTFWSTYKNWSTRYGRGRYNQESSTSAAANRNFFGDPTDNNSAISSTKECSSSSLDSTSSSCRNSNRDIIHPITNECSSPPALSSVKLHPRSRARKSSKVTNTDLTTAAYNCCLKSCPPCQALNIRGGDISSSASKIVSETMKTAIADGAMPTPYNLPLNMWKIIFQIFLTTINVLCWYLPLRAKNFSENKFGLSLANAFSGGVFLSLAFGHLIPECVHGFEGYNEALPFMIVLGGYLLIFFVEKVAFDAEGIMHDFTNPEQDQIAIKTASSSEKGMEELVEADRTHSSGRGAVILLGALAVHSILEMTALGLADSFGDSALLSLSIALHQPAESIALLVAFIKSGLPKNQIIQFLSIFSAMGPIGVAIGMAVNEFAAPIVDAIMLATVAGTFVYVGATEVIPEEWEDQEHKWSKFFALISGIVSIFVITQYTTTLEGHTM